MKKEIVTFDEKEVFEKAKDNFVRICGFRTGEEKDNRLLQLGMEARRRGLGGIDIKAVVSSYDAQVYRDHTVNIEGTSFTCTPFSQIEENIIKRIYLYMLTVGECTQPE